MPTDRPPQVDVRISSTFVFLALFCTNSPQPTIVSVGMPLRSIVSSTVALASCAFLGACHHGSHPAAALQDYTIGGNVTGLAAGAQVTLDDNGTDALTVAADGTFTFATPVVQNAGYAVTVATQPTGQMCTVSKGSGTGVTADVTTVAVICSTDTYSIGGSVAGLASDAQVILENNGADALTLSANGSFTFSTPVAYDSGYAVTVSTQPTGQVCTVSKGSGAGVTANVTTVSITCSTDTYTVGGSITGLATGTQVTLDNNAADPLTVNANGTFTFSTPVAYGGSYAVTVGTQPVGQTCTVSNGSGGAVKADVATVSITCSADTYTIGGTVTGLTSGAQVTLENNGADPLTVTANGSFTFSTPVAFAGSYAVTVGTQPSGQDCVVTNGAGSDVTANVSNVSVTCTQVTETVVASFGATSTAGTAPYAGLIQGSDGNFYGTTSAGGTNNRGSVFKVTPDGTLTVLYSFGSLANNADGYTPYSGLIQGSDGNFYGTTAFGGPNGGGTVFKVTPAGALTVIYSFSTSGTDGLEPLGTLLQGSDGNFYGTTVEGGANNNGVVFKVTPSGVETVLHSFGTLSSGDAAAPETAALVQGSDGNFYGTTLDGGANNTGAVFKVTPAGVETVLYSFGSSTGTDGNEPEGGLTQGTDGNFYGTTRVGGANGAGTVFKITPAGVETVIYSFPAINGTNSADPYSGLLLGSDGNFYGTTLNGGGANVGTIFKVTPTGVETLLYAFGSHAGDGATPRSGLIMGTDGHFYGTTTSGGTYDAGTVFRF